MTLQTAIAASLSLSALREQRMVDCSEEGFVEAMLRANLYTSAMTGEVNHIDAGYYIEILSNAAD